MNGPENPFAFPSEQSEALDGGWNDTLVRGMTLRDWFAGQALAGPVAVLAHHCAEHERDFASPEAAAAAYRIADAMLAERKTGAV